MIQFQFSFLSLSSLYTAEIFPGKRAPVAATWVEGETIIVGAWWMFSLCCHSNLIINRTCVNGRRVNFYGQLENVVKRLCSGHVPQFTALADRNSFSYLCAIKKHGIIKLLLNQFKNLKLFNVEWELFKDFVSKLDWKQFLVNFK